MNEFEDLEHVPNLSVESSSAASGLGDVVRSQPQARCQLEHGTACTATANSGVCACPEATPCPAGTSQVEVSPCAILNPSPNRALNGKRCRRKQFSSPLASRSRACLCFGRRTTRSEATRAKETKTRTSTCMQPNEAHRTYFFHQNGNTW